MSEEDGVMTRGHNSPTIRMGCMVGGHTGSRRSRSPPVRVLVAASPVESSSVAFKSTSLRGVIVLVLVMILLLSSSSSSSFSTLVVSAAFVPPSVSTSRTTTKTTTISGKTLFVPIRSSPFITTTTAAAAAAPVNEGSIQVPRPHIVVEGGDGSNTNTSTTMYNISYRVVRPMSLSSRQAAPILVLHGGPSVPSDYLYSLEQVIPYRSIIFYDQLGCGRSDEPKDSTLYSIENSIHDLQLLMKHLGLRRFHLYGQSFGGILAYEYMKHLCDTSSENNNNDDIQCLSAILSSTPTDIQQVEQEVERLLQELQPQEEEKEAEKSVEELFRTTHQCRTVEYPQALKDSYAHAGTVWRGTKAISTYQAEQVSSDSKRMPSTMILRGEYDFVTELCIQDWKDLYNHPYVRYKTITNCSHHGLLEQPLVYGDVIDSYFSEYD